MGHSGESEHTLTRRATTVVSIVAASLLVILKLGTGLVTGSLGLISSGIDSSDDVLAAALTFFAVRLGGRPADFEHPYGHRRAENLGALGEAAILLGGGILVSVEAITRLSASGKAPTIHWYQFAVIAVALVVEVARLSVAMVAARRYNSPALRSNALHFASDIAASLVVLAGLLAVRAGLSQGDSLAALLVAAIIFAAAIRLIAENANALMDRAPEQARTIAEHAIAALGGDIELGRLRLRESAGRYFADVVVSVPPGQAVVEGHRAADLVEGALERALPGSDVVVHVEPRDRGLDLRDRVLAIALSEPLVKEAHDITIFEQAGSRSVSLHLKFPADLSLQAAHEIAERVEQAIRERPGVGDVQTHLEPLERPLLARPQDATVEPHTKRAIEQLVRKWTGRDPERVRLLSTDAGQVLFLTLLVGPEEPLTDAHELAGELEDELRQRIDGIAEVIVHTEP
jgi:cation diffusion facilitator family transporter